MDRIFHSFLERQHLQAMELAAASDVLDLQPVDAPPHRRYLASFRCRGMVKLPGQGVLVVEHFLVGIQFADDYLRRLDPMRVVQVLVPVFHPNVGGPVVCLGALRLGTTLSEICYQLHEILTWNRLTMREDDALNHEACRWARSHPEAFPLDDRPLRRRRMTLRASTCGPEDMGRIHA